MTPVATGHACPAVSEVSEPDGEIRVAERIDSAQKEAVFPGSLSWGIKGGCATAISMFGTGHGSSSPAIITNLLPPQHVVFGSGQIIPPNVSRVTNPTRSPAASFGSLLGGAVGALFPLASATFAMDVAGPSPCRSGVIERHSYHCGDAGRANDRKATQTETRSRPGTSVAPPVNGFPYGDRASVLADFPLAGSLSVSGPSPAGALSSDLDVPPKPCRRHPEGVAGIFEGRPA